MHIFPEFLLLKSHDFLKIKSSFRMEHCIITKEARSNERASLYICVKLFVKSFGEEDFQSFVINGFAKAVTDEEE